LKLPDKIFERYPDRIAEVKKVEQINASVSAFVLTVVALGDAQTSGDIGLEQLRLLPQTANQIEKDFTVALPARRANRFSGHRARIYGSVDVHSKMD